MPYLIIRTDVRKVSGRDGDHRRDELDAPERRRQTAMADSWDAAMRMARALSACGAVRNGAQRVKVIRLG